MTTEVSMMDFLITRYEECCLHKRHLCMKNKAPASQSLRRLKKIHTDVKRHTTTFFSFLYIKRFLCTWDRFLQYVKQKWQCLCSKTLSCSKEMHTQSISSIFLPSHRFERSVVWAINTSNYSMLFRVWESNSFDSQFGFYAWFITSCIIMALTFLFLWNNPILTPVCHWAAAVSN